MAKIDWVDQRLSLWAEWVVRGRSGIGGSMLAMFNGEPSDNGPPTARIPLNEEECWQTEAGIMQLDGILQETVVTHYTGGTMEISRAVLSRRLDDAHRQLAAMWLVAAPLDQQLPRGF
jgi:hypothetical protein